MEYKCQTKNGFEILSEDDIVLETQPIIWAVLRRKYATFARHHEDISQEVLMDVLKSLARYDPNKGEVYNYIQVVVLRRVRDEAKKIIAREKHQATLTPEMEHQLRQQTRIPIEEEDEELAALINRLRRQLTAEERIVLEMKEDGRSSTEIYKELHPESEATHPGQAISKIMEQIAQKAKKLGLNKRR